MLEEVISFHAALDLDCRALLIMMRQRDRSEALFYYSPWEDQVLLAYHDYDWTVAEEHFRLALDLNRDDARAHLWYAGIVLSPTGRLREADFHQQRAVELDPMSPVLIAGFGADWIFQRQYDSAISSCQRALELDPTYPWALRWLGEAYLLRGMYKEAAATLERIATPVFGAGLLGWSYLQSGFRAKANGMLREFERQRSPALACQHAILSLAFGNQKAAVTSLGQACASRNVGVHWLGVDPIWDPIRRNPGFQESLAHINLPSAS